MLLVFVAFTQSCETEIPPEDPTPPKFSFQIHGDGFFHTFNQDTDFENIELRLKRGTTYNFTLAGSDDGGLERIQWIISNSSQIFIDVDITSPWTYTNTSTSSPTISWFGDSGNPLTGSVITGNFKTPPSTGFSNFQFNVADFGGEGRDPNYILKRLNIYTGSHQTRIINR